MTRASFPISSVFLAVVSCLLVLVSPCRCFSFSHSATVSSRARSDKSCSRACIHSILSVQRVPSFDDRGNAIKRLKNAFAVGATAGKDGISDDDRNKKSTNKGRKPTWTLASLALLAVAIGCVRNNRQNIASALSNINPSHLNESLVTWLDHLNNAGAAGLAVYTAFFWVWEMTAGITTPVETAAGMAFGVRKGILANCIGKTGGAMSAFLLGRWVFYDTVHAKLKQNEILGLVEESIKEHPLGVTLLCRLSPLPEFVKNFGLSVLQVRARYFLLAVLLHGIPFTCLWTCLGAETAQMMRGGAASKTLKYLVTGVTWFGLVVSPTLIGFWVKTLKEKQKHRHENDSETDFP